MLRNINYFVNQVVNFFLSFILKNTCIFKISMYICGTETITKNKNYENFKN